MAWWSRLAVAVLAAVAVGGGGYWWWTQQRPAAPVPAPQPPLAASASVPDVAASAPPAVRYPIEDVAAGVEAELPAAPADAERLVADALVVLLGRKDVQSFVQLDGFVRRAVTTIDNLGRAQASARLWPVTPTRGRFGTVERGGSTTIAAANAERYMPFVRFATDIDAARAAALYVRLYPLFQRAYDELGYPGRHFNDRLVDVIDLLLATPEPAAAPTLRLTEVQGPMADPRPWVRYEFADPTLEARPAGQKILLRIGSRNARLLKDKLREFRAQIVKAR
ncbi:MAG TPA: DUF3014 domain-containing protein [Methylibium sp.]|uniref:DUF3014 domain-containing protein n=1 Tax=Methylibium sp. TaxID=2067992 RepID=UPI002DBD295C|nr:DUF3014 domain-containing protein [Methylibium sp.]HEU4460652.1 DUF3014 domain-containing protein [Methylibium sp.]